MTGKEYLEQGRRLNLRIDFLYREIQRLKVLACSVSSPQMSGDRVKSSRPNDSSFASMLAKINDMEDSMNHEIDQLVSYQKQVRRVVFQLQDPETEVILLYHYLENLSWSAIAAMLNMDRKTVQTRRDKGLKKLVLPDDAIHISLF